MTQIFLDLYYFLKLLSYFFIYLELNLLAVRPGLGLAAGGVLDLAGEGVGHPHVGHLLGLVVPDLPWRISRYYLVRQHAWSRRGHAWWPPSYVGAGELTLALLI